MDTKCYGYGFLNLSSKQDEVRGKRGLSKYAVFQSSEEYYIKTHILHQITSSYISFECL